MSTHARSLICVGCVCVCVVRFTRGSSVLRMRDISVSIEWQVFDGKRSFRLEVLSCEHLSCASTTANGNLNWKRFLRVLFFFGSFCFVSVLYDYFYFFVRVRMINATNKVPVQFSEHYTAKINQTVDILVWDNLYIDRVNLKREQRENKISDKNVDHRNELQ